MSIEAILSKYDAESDYHAITWQDNVLAEKCQELEQKINRMTQEVGILIEQVQTLQAEMEPDESGMPASYNELSLEEQHMIWAYRRKVAKEEAANV